MDNFAIGLVWTINFAIGLFWFVVAFTVLAGVSWFCGWKPGDIRAVFRSGTPAHELEKAAFERYWGDRPLGTPKLEAWALWKEMATHRRWSRRPQPSEILASLFGIAGAWLLATQYHPAFGFAAFLLSNFGGIKFNLAQRHWWIVVQQVFFLGSSLVGLWNWWLGPLVLG